NGDGCHEAMSLKGTHHTSSTDRRHHRTAVQAMSQQKVFKIFNDKKMVIQLQPKACYPQCQ
ncbi:hypothetical protein ACET98_15635, partial [Aeromonas veronii]